MLANSLSKQATLKQKMHTDAEIFMNLEVFSNSCFAPIALRSMVMPTQANVLHQLVPHLFLHPLLISLFSSPCGLYKLQKLLNSFSWSHSLLS